MHFRESFSCASRRVMMQQAPAWPLVIDVQSVSELGMQDLDGFLASHLEEHAAWAHAVYPDVS